jgi:hypothetical protein
METRNIQSVTVGRPEDAGEAEGGVAVGVSCMGGGEMGSVTGTIDTIGDDMSAVNSPGPQAGQLLVETEN